MAFDNFPPYEHVEATLTLPTPAFSLAQRLRVETAEAHAKLEATVGFDIHRPSVAIATGMLQSFYRVLTTLEPAMMALLPLRLRERQRLPLLRADLAVLGLSTEARSVAQDRMALPQNEAEALGALYVMEGSTLGGKLITKSLKQCTNWPLRGITYFNPYGERTGSMWAEFQLELSAVSYSCADDVVRGANQTFAILESALALEAVC